MAKKKEQLEEVYKPEETNDEIAIPPSSNKKYAVILTTSKELIVKDEKGNGYSIPINKQNKNAKIGDIVYSNIF